MISPEHGQPACLDVSVVEVEVLHQGNEQKISDVTLFDPD